jgi:N-acyl-D-aspartate/D-glutamate deacylase
MPSVFDLLIDGAVVVDGTGAPGYAAAVGTQDGKIVWIGRSAPPPAPDALRTVHARGRVLSPGFVDVHTHSDLSALVDPETASTLRQGVTTVIVGNCGSSPWPPAGASECAQLAGADPEEVDLGFSSFGGYLDRIEAARPAVNLAGLVGHGAVRAQAMGDARRTPSSGELDEMRHLVAEAMDEGALGLSTGLIYVPGIHAETDEIVALAEVAARADGRYASHIRGEGTHLFKAVDEALEIGRRAGLPVQVSHLKCETAFTWGRAHDLLDRLHAGEDVTADQYPYAAWASTLSSLLPPWAPVERLQDVLDDDASRERLVRAVEDGEGDAFQSSVAGVGWERIVIESTAADASNGLSVAAIAERRGLEPIDACFELLVDDPDTSCIGHAMDEADVGTILADPEVMVASDSAAMSPEGPFGGLPVHPRNYGTFPRVLGPYVRSGTLALEQAVRKMTSLPADRFGLSRRGRIAEGMLADMVLFDADRIADAPLHGSPHRFPEGIDLVVVNGSIAWDGRKIARHGRVLRRSMPAG